MEICIADGENPENWIAMCIRRVNFYTITMKFKVFHASLHTELHLTTHS